MFLKFQEGLFYSLLTCSKSIKGKFPDHRYHKQNQTDIFTTAGA